MLKFFRLKVFAVNLIIFIVISVLVSFLCIMIPSKEFYYKRWLFKEKKWERNGIIYQRIFKVKLWKKYLPELSDFVKSILPKKHIKEYSKAYLSKYLIESCRAEFTHWNILISSFVFYLWNDSLRAMVIILIAAAFNFPYIIIQRYNRPRIIRLIHQREYPIIA